MKTLTLFLTILGGGASIAGVVWIVVSAHMGVARLRSERQRILDWPDSPDKSEEMRAAGLRFTTYRDMLTLRQDVAITVLESARFTWPVAITLIGIAVSTVASLLPLVTN